jgi:hypothetical protein
LTEHGDCLSGGAILKKIWMGIYILQQLPLHHSLVVRRVVAAKCKKNQYLPPSVIRPISIAFHFHCAAVRVRYLEGVKRKKEKASKLIAAMPKRH